MRSILVIRFSSLGDIILTEPIVRALRDNYGEAEILFLTKARYAELPAMFAAVDETHTLDEDGNLSALTKRLKELDVDLIVDLHNNPRSAYVRSKLGIPAVRSQKEWFKRVLTVRWKRLGVQPKHQIERCAEAVKKLGITVEVAPPRIVVPHTAREWWAEQKPNNQQLSDYYVLAAGASYETKRAPDELLEGIHRELHSVFGYPVVFVGGAAEQKFLESLARKLNPPPAGVFANLSFSNVAAILQDSRFVISNDSGLAHLAAAVEAPVVALFGPTHPILGFRPLGTRSHAYTVNEYCSPCSLHGNRPCYRQERFCFTRMQPNDIAQVVAKLLNS